MRTKEQIETLSRRYPQSAYRINGRSIGRHGGDCLCYDCTVDRIAFKSRQTGNGNDDEWSDDQQDDTYKIKAVNRFFRLPNFFRRRIK